MTEKIHQIDFKTTLPSLMESNPCDGDQFHLLPNKNLKTRKTQQFASKREETDSFDLLVDLSDAYTLYKSEKMIFTSILTI